MPKRKTARISKKRKSSFKKPLFVLGLIFSLVIAVVLGYSAFQYQNSEQEADGFFTCDKTGKVCELSQHIHGNIDVTICEEEVNFSKEKGSLGGQHTHKELDLIHWHTSIKVDPATRKPIDLTPIMLKSFFESMEQEIPQSCNGKAAQTAVMVNDVKTDLGLDYVWEDGDRINVIIQ